MEKIVKPEITTKFPIGFWNYCPLDSMGPEAVNDWVDAGMTLAMSPDFDSSVHNVQDMIQVLDAAHGKGIRVIITDTRGYSWRNNDPEKYRDEFLRAVKDFGDHPAVFGFHVGDEPGADDFEKVCQAVKIQVELAPHLTPFLNLLPFVDNLKKDPGIPCIGYYGYADYLDEFVKRSKTKLLSYDCYAQMLPLPDCFEGHDGWEMYFNNLKEYQAASSRHGIPMWVTQLSTGHFRYRCPTENDFRWQLNTAIAHGAKGIMWFFFYMRKPHSNFRVAPIDEHWERTETFEWLSRTNRTFLKWHASIVENLELVKVYHIGKSWAGFPSSTQDSELIHYAGSTTPLILSEFKDPDGRDYVAVVNNSQTDPTKAEIAFKGVKPKVWRIDWGGEEVDEATDPYRAQKSGYDFAKVQAWLAPGQMELYRIESSPVC